MMCFTHLTPLPLFSGVSLPSSRLHFTSFRTRMSSSSIDSAPPPPPGNGIVIGCGGTTVDFLATVDSYPKPDDKIRSTSLKVQGGGNAGNALTCAARLGLTCRLISKARIVVANDSQGKGILEELESDGVDTSFLVVSKEGNTPFTYVIVDKQTQTRTCIHTPGYPPMVPTDLPQSTMLSALDRASIAYFDVRLHETALVIAKEASRKKIPILVDAEKKRDGLDELLQLADYVVCTAKFPQAWTEVSSIPCALVSMLLRLPKLKFVIVTLGEEGCLMIQRASTGNKPDTFFLLIILSLGCQHPLSMSTSTETSESKETDIGSLVESLKQRSDSTATFPTCVSSETTKLKANGIGTLSGRLFLGTAEKIPPEELVDTTGAGDAFIGAVLYALCAGMPPEKMLPFATQVAACNCRALGARTGLPHRTDPRLVPFLVTYQTEQFLEKNKDYVVAEHQALLNASKCTFVSCLFPLLAEDANKKTKFSSIGSRFKQQLVTLLETLSTTEPHYIRCVKPNNLLKPLIFENQNVLQQLRCGGVMEAIRISCAGFPTRKQFEEFLERFSVLAPEVSDNSSDDVAACKKLLEKVGLEGYQIGKTKVFLRAGQMADLDARRNEVLGRAATSIQRKFRSYLFRKNLMMLRKAAVNMQAVCRAPSSAETSAAAAAAAAAVIRPVEAKDPALLFKQQLTAYVEKIFGMIRDNLKNELQALLSLCIQAPRTSTGRSLRSAKSLGKDSPLEHWKGIIDGLYALLNTLKENFVPPVLIQKIFTQTFSFINVQLFNSLLLRRECCTFSNGEYVKSGLTLLEEWCAETKEEYAGSSWDELKHIRQAVGFLVIHKKYRISYDDIALDLCPILSVQQLYRICTLYWDDSYNTRSVSQDVISSMRVLMIEDSNDADSSAFLLDEDSSIPFTTEDLSSSMQDKDFAEMKPAEELEENPAFSFLL
ncbi:hypothetical protein F2Q68_00029318 [Brassica cretica]|uniref:Myosin motor domain-containing protein n=1 Tax=Brassica cretica TaxID=69181 RepID=A0A8S9GFN6_BRACR|nr:hypothetical protein F2Q68_00029318 [Brassica cretica]